MSNILFVDDDIDSLEINVPGMNGFELYIALIRYPPLFRTGSKILRISSLY
jgi:hypothetical protein